MANTRTRLDAKRRDSSKPVASSTQIDVNALAATKDSAEVAAEFLRTMGSGHRLMILCFLMDGAKSVTEICEAIDARQSLVSQHLIRLRQGGLVKADRRGNFVHYSLANTPVADIVAILQTYFCPDVMKRGSKN
ncbi:MAG: metalloregulator ArsR/SmtB family transcription factor [Hyphomicrobiaceae bacterium]